MIWGHCIYCALYFYFCYISSISNHQAFDPRGWGPCFIRSMFCKDFLLVCGLCFHFLWQCPLKYKRPKFWWSPAYLRSLSKVTEICACIFLQEFYNFDLDFSSWAIVSDLCMVWVSPFAYERTVVLAPFVDKILFRYWLTWYPFGKAVDHKCEGLFVDSCFYSINLYACLHE